jgi:tRNA G18 (ribose-2'-O)-methylase SpoU
MTRRQLRGAAEIADALSAGRPVRQLFVSTAACSETSRAVVARCEAAGIPVREASEREIARLSQAEDRAPQEILALEGLAPDAPLEDVLAAPEAVWLLVDIGYPGNAGFAIRTAEVAGAAGIVIDAPFDHDARRQALRTSMRADRVFPVHFEDAERTVEAARAAGRHVIGIEDGGTVAPWEVDLTGSVLLVVGGEARGISERILSACETIVRIPMQGFIPSFNLQAAVAMVAGERLRQEAMARPKR